MINIKIGKALVLTAVLFGAATAACASPWSWSGSLADWAASAGGTGVITDGDGDMAFELYNTTSIPDGVGAFITISEINVGSTDTYDVGITWDSDTGFPSGYSGGGQLVYSMKVLSSTERIHAAALDTVITGAGTAALTRLYNLPDGTFFLNLSSFDGSKDPVIGYAGFSDRTYIGVQDVFQPSSTGIFQDAHNSFTVSGVPEPMSLALFGAGMAALHFSRRNKNRQI